MFLPSAHRLIFDRQRGAGQKLNLSPARHAQKLRGRSRGASERCDERACVENQPHEGTISYHPQCDQSVSRVVFSIMENTIKRSF